MECLDYKIKKIEGFVESSFDFLFWKETLMGRNVLEDADITITPNKGFDLIFNSQEKIYLDISFIQGKWDLILGKSTIEAFIGLKLTKKNILKNVNYFNTILNNNLIERIYYDNSVEIISTSKETLVHVNRSFLSKAFVTRPIVKEYFYASLIEKA